ncbi:MAG: peptidylprolyl isomerase [Acidobacteriota bacterium]
MWIERLQTIARSPAVHFVLLGSLLFVASSWRRPMPDGVTDRGPIEIPSARIAEAEQAFRAERRRVPNAAEKAELVETLIDEEVLFRHALALGLQEAEVPRRRLAQIAAFLEPEVEPNTGQTDPTELARRAIELGLHEGDFVTRRVLIDAARRLVRGAGRLVEPTDEAVADYLRAHGERFRDEDRFRVSHVLASRARHDDPSTVASTRLDRWQRSAIDDLDAMPPGDPSLVPPRLPLLGVRALERRFGVGFARQLADLPVGSWAGPIPSRHGAHLVFVHEHRSGTVPDATTVADAVRAILREEAADRWMAARLRQLREGRAIRVREGGDTQEVTS